MKKLVNKKETFKNRLAARKVVTTVSDTGFIHSELFRGEAKILDCYSPTGNVGKITAPTDAYWKVKV